MNREFGIPLAAAVLCLCLAGQVEAQTQTSSQAADPVGQNQASLEATVDTIYDTNVPRSNPALARQRGLKLIDESERPGAAIDLLKAIGQQSLFLRGVAGYTFYDRNRILNSERIDMTGGADLRAGACQAVLSNEYARRENNLEEAIDVPIAKNLQTLETVGLSGTCVRTIGFTPISSVSTTWATNSNSELRSRNYRSTSAQLGVAYQHPTLGRLSIYGLYNNVDYYDQTVPGDPSLHEGFDTYGAGVHFERSVGARLDGAIDLSYMSLSQNTPGAQGFNGLNYSADLNAHVTGRLGATLHAGRSTKTSLQLSSEFNIVDNYSGEIDYRISDQKQLALGVTQKRNDYMGVEASSSTILTHQTTSDIYAQGTLGFARRFSLILDVRHEDSTANINVFDYSSMRVTLTLTARL